MPEELQELNDNKIIATKLVAETDQQKINQLIDIFNINMSKKNALRALKLDELYDDICDQLADRIKQRSDEFSNKDLLDYFKTVKDATDTAATQAAELKDAPSIQYNQQNNINVAIQDTISEESREKILDTVKSILNKINQGEIDTQNEYSEGKDDDNRTINTGVY